MRERQIDDHETAQNPGAPLAYGQGTAIQTHGADRIHLDLGLLDARRGAHAFADVERLRVLLVRQADTTIFVVRWEKTRRDVATTGIKMVHEAGARLSGIVLSQVDLRRHAQYDYTDSGVFYYRGYKRYYGDA